MSAERHLEWDVSSREKLAYTREQLIEDKAVYESVLRHEPAGTKSNPIQLDVLQRIKPEAISAHLVGLSNNWKHTDEDGSAKLGNITGLDTYTRQNVERLLK